MSKSLLVIVDFFINPDCFSYNYFKRPDYILALPLTHHQAKHSYAITQGKYSFKVKINMGANMEKITSLAENKNLNESLFLQNRKNLKVEGVNQVLASSETNIHLKLKDTSLSILGSSIHITKLDVSAGVLEAEGNFELIKYGKVGNIFKRIFK